jgi:manganese transport protein
MKDQKNVATASLSEVHSSVDTMMKPTGWKKFASFLGPAYLVSVG